jgi:AcrR family transcriptional regulator
LNALADAEGLGAVSMRAVASALGTGAGSLHRYLSSRDDLLDLMGDAVVGTLAPFPVAADPFDAMVSLARHQLALYQAHPWLVELVQRGGSPGPNGLAYFDHCLGVLAPLPCAVARKFEAIAMVTGLVSLFARPAPAGFSFDGFDFAPYPNLLTALSTPAPGPRSPAPDLFERTVRSVLSGLLT